MLSKSLSSKAIVVNITRSGRSVLPSRSAVALIITTSSSGHAASANRKQSGAVPAAVSMSQLMMASGVSAADTTGTRPASAGAAGPSTAPRR